MLKRQLDLPSPEAAGCEVLTYRGNEISLAGPKAATCLTRPILLRGS